MDQHHENEFQFMDKLQRHKALLLLVTGAAFGISGFAFAAIAGFAGYSDHSLLNEVYASGHPHFPLTVSEMVHDPNTPTGKAFLGFELLAAILLLTSWYPYQLGNVYVGDRHNTFSDLTERCAGWISWATLRQLLPSLGLGLVALITTTPTYDKKSSDVSFVTCQIHIIAATALFGGYILCEVQCLFMAYSQGLVKIGKRERRIRIVVIIITAIGAVTTIMIQFTYPYLSNSTICPGGQDCKDVWIRMDEKQLMIWINRSYQKYPNGDLLNITKGKAMRSRAEHLYLNEGAFESNTAYGTARHLKMICFWAEVIAGVFGLFSHMVIWWYAPERHVLLGDYIEFKDIVATSLPSHHSSSFAEEES